MAADLTRIRESLYLLAEGLRHLADSLAERPGPAPPAPAPGPAPRRPRRPVAVPPPDVPVSDLDKARVRRALLGQQQRSK